MLSAPVTPMANLVDSRFVSTSSENLAHVQATQVAKISLSDIDMTDYGTALSPGQQSQVTQAKTNIKSLWDAAFQEPNLQFLPSKRLLNDIQLKVAVIGGGIGGSAMAAAASQLGHKVTLLEMRQKPPSRENLVTINQKSREILNSLLTGTAQQQLFQTQGDLGFSERAPLAAIETALQETAKASGECEILRHIQVNQVTPAPQHKANLTFKTQGGQGKQRTLENLDLVVVATGAKSASPYHNAQPDFMKHFSITPFGKDLSALCYMKYRFPLGPKQTPPPHLEINRHQIDAKTGKENTASFVNLYTGRTLTIAGQNFYETSLLFDCPPAWAQADNLSHLKDSLHSMAKTFMQDNNPEVKKLGQAMFLQPESYVQQGVALVSHWMAEKAYSEHLPMILVGDAAAPAHPWTGSGANLAMHAIKPLRQLLTQLSFAQHASKENLTPHKENSMALQVFEAQVKPLRLQSLLRGLFASGIFSKTLDPVAKSMNDQSMRLIV